MFRKKCFFFTKKRHNPMHPFLANLLHLEILDLNAVTHPIGLTFSERSIAVLVRERWQNTE